MTSIGNLWSRAAVVLAAAWVASGCLVIADVELADITGDWSASQARFAEPGNLNNTFDLIEDGWTVTLEISSEGGFALTLDEPGAAPDVRVGTLTVEGGKDITFTRFDGTVGQGEVFLEDGTMALLFDEFAGIEADLNQNGEPIPVTLLLVVERQ